MSCIYEVAWYPRSINCKISIGKYWRYDEKKQK